MIWRILVGIAGVLLLLPGLCTVVFGFMFLASSYTLVMALVWFLVGGGLTWAGIAILIAASQR